MKTFIRSFSGGVQRVFGNAPGGAASVPRWTAAELGLMSLAGVLLLIGVLVIATGGQRPAPAGTAPDANVTATKVGAPDPVSPGAPLDFTITFHTDVTITVFSVDDPIPAQVDYVSSDVNNLGALNCGLVGSTMECRNGTLGADQTGTVTMHTMVHANATGTIGNTASYVWAGGPQQQVSGAVNVIGPSPTPTIVPTDTPGPPTDTPTIAVPTDTPTTGPPTDTPTPGGVATDTPTPVGSQDTPTETPTAGPPIDTPTPGLVTDTPTSGPATDTPTPGSPTVTPRLTPTPPPSDTPTPPGGPPSDTPTPPVQVSPSDTPVTPLPTDTEGPSPTPFTPPTFTPPPPPPPPPPGPGRGGTPTEVTGCGDITGTLRVTGGSASGLTVELRRKSNNGGDIVLGTTTTDGNGVFHFRNVGSSPSDGVYYIRYPGGSAGTVAVWFAPGFTYTSCSTKQLDAIDVTDVPFTGICNGGNLALPGAITWTPRNTTDRYRLFVYAGTTLVLDTGDVGNTGSYTVAAGRLPDGNYTARLTITAPDGGNGQSSSSCVFSIGAPTGGTPVPPPAPPPGFGTPAATATKGINATAVVPATIPSGPAGPDVRVSMTVDQAAAYPGETLDYTISVVNMGSAAATNAVLTDQLADGLLLDPSNTTAARGQLKLTDNTVQVAFGTVAAGERIIVNVRASVIGSPGSILTNSAIVAYDQTATPVKSNVVETLVVGFGTPKPVKTSTPSGTVKGTVVPVTTPKPSGKTPVPAGTGTKTNSTGTTAPRTGGEFPLFTGLTLVLLALLLRQVRLRRQATAGNRS